MARPNPPQRLAHGLFLSAKTFPRFVETWNWLVAFADNLCGDKDRNGANGRITLDRADPDRPVIRIANAARGAGESVFPGCFEPEIEGASVSFRNQYAMVGGSLVDCGVGDIDIARDTFVCLSFDATGGGGGAEIVKAYSADEVRTLQGNAEKSVVPLFLFGLDDDGGAVVKCDFRKGAFAQQWEVGI